MSEQSQQDYEEMPYAGAAYRLTHPDSIATIASVFGLTPATPRKCRVLELGCASGLNLVPMAHALPESSFVGIDAGKNHIAAAEAFRNAVGLRNIRFEQKNILEIDRSFGEFDYILCHGIFSWVPRAVQDKIFEICKNNLSDNGVAYISYNTNPGWRLRGIMRDVMLQAAGTEGSINARLETAARAIHTLGSLVEVSQDPYSRMLKDEIQRVLQQEPWYIAHEYLAGENDALYFTEFMKRASAYGMQYLADAGISRMTASGLSPEAQQRLATLSTDAIHHGQLLDLLRNTMFRRTLLCRQGRPINRRIEPTRLRSYLASSRMKLQPGSAVDSAVFLHPRGMRIELRHPLAITILKEVAAHAPQCLAVESILAMYRPEEHAAVMTSVAEAYLADIIDLRSTAPPCATVGGPHSGASPIAAYLAEKSLPIINLCHEQVRLAPHEAQALLRLAEGNPVVDADVRALAGHALLLA